MVSPGNKVLGPLPTKRAVNSAVGRHESFGVSYGGYTAACSCGAEFNRHTRLEALKALRYHLVDPSYGALAPISTGILMEDHAPDDCEFCEPQRSEQ